VQGAFGLLLGGRLHDPPEGGAGVGVGVGFGPGDDDGLGDGAGPPRIGVGVGEGITTGIATGDCEGEGVGSVDFVGRASCRAWQPAIPTTSIGTASSRAVHDTTLPPRVIATSLLT